MIGLLVLSLVLLVLSGIFSGMETGIYSLERVRLQVKAAQGQRVAERLLELVQSPGATVCTLLLANNIVNYGLAFLGGRILLRLTGPSLSDIELELWSTALVVPVVFVFGELLPKNLFMRYAGALVSLASPMYRIAHFVLYPLVRPLLWLIGKLSRGPLVRTGSLLRRESLVGMLTRDDEAERLTEGQREIAGRVLGLRSMTVAERMVPIERVVAVGRDAGARTIVEASAQSGRSRILVRSSTGREFLGYVNVLDAAFAIEGDFSLDAVLYDLPRVRSDQPITSALKTLQRARRPLAIVTQESNIAGIISTSEIVDVLVSGPDAERTRES